MDAMNQDELAALANMNQMAMHNLEEQNILLLCVVAQRRRRLRMLRKERQQQAGRARAPRPRRWYTKGWVLGRAVHSQYENLFEQLDRECRGDYVSYLRMDRNTFAEILRRVGPRITKSPR